MTTPNQSTPDGSLGPGQFAAWQAMTEEDAKAKMRTPLGAWDGAQAAVQGELAPRGFVNREVVRLDNRIDQIAYGDNTLSLLYTYSESGVWEKPPGATKVIVNVLAGSSGGGKTNYPSGDFSPGQGGFSGGWSRGEFNAADVPATVNVTVGVGGAGATVTDSVGAAGQGSSFGTLVSAGGAGSTSYGAGNVTFRMRGGLGGGNINDNDTFVPASPGSDGSYQAGGRGGAKNTPGENGASIDESMILGGQRGMGSSGGGGGMANFGDRGGNGGAGGWPSGAGGGGGANNGYNAGSGHGGNGAAGAVWIEVYLKDTAGIAPSAPTNVAASNITQVSAKLTWTASTDDVAVLRYEILRDGTQVGSSSTPTYDLTGLNAGTTYQITVRAVDLGSNKSPESTALSLTTLT